MDEFLRITLPSFFGVVIAVVILQVQNRERASDRALLQVNKKLDVLLRKAGIDLYADVPMEVKEALQNGQKISAIKHYRQSTGMSLKDAKDRVEEIMRRSDQLK